MKIGNKLKQARPDWFRHSCTHGVIRFLNAKETLTDKNIERVSQTLHARNSLVPAWEIEQQLREIIQE